MAAAVAVADRQIVVTYLIDGAPQAFRATVDADGQQPYRDGGLSVTWEREARTGERGSKRVFGPVDTPEGEGDTWRWVHPRAASETQRRLADIAARGLEAQRRARA